jgi:hypothetical protein
MAKHTIGFDPNSDDGRNLDASVGELILNLQKPNTIEDRKLRQLLAELQAGRQYAKAPKAKTVILDELLAKPMRQIAGHRPPLRVRKTAADFLNWYQRRKAGRKAMRER